MTLGSLKRTFAMGFTDWIDIIIIASFFYALLVLFKRTRAYTIFFGVVMVVILYLISNSFNLILTKSLLQYFVGISAIVFAIVFQTEIRRFFEFLGLLGTRQIKVGPFSPTSPQTAEIIQSAVSMAQNRIGALIVIQGKDNLDRYTKGGINLDGLISEELIISIFDNHTPGHDGALIIVNNRLSKFATHLPLSNNFKEIGKHGTRHSAALGLSEVCDALVIVVSEEKGQISIARDGKLKTLENFSDLEKELERYIKNKFNLPTNKSFIEYLKKDLLLKIIALLLALALRVYITGY